MSPAGLTRGSIVFPRTLCEEDGFLRRGWIAGSSPAMTTVIAARVGPSPASRHANLPSPAGLTRGSILFVRTFLRTGWIAPQLGLARVAQYNAPQVGLTRLAVSSPAMTTAIGGVSSQTLVPPTAGE